MLKSDPRFYEQMPKLRIAVLRGGEELLASPSCLFPRLAIEESYQDGDQIIVESERAGVWLALRLDACLDEALVYLAEKKLVYSIPLGEKKVAMNPLCFGEGLKMITARPARREEVFGRRCLSFNPYDQHENDMSYPHAHANVETRGEAWFAARNAIDGEYANQGHGAWPYQSWGINRDPEAAMTVDLAAEAELDEVRITIRCDFPHDAWWSQADLVFDDEKRLTFSLEKTDLPQVFRLPEAIRCRSVRLERLIKADDPSPFPALTQLELWGEYCE